MANCAYKMRIYPSIEQKILLEKTFGCVRFIYNKMLGDKITYYEKNHKMLRNTPAQYKSEFLFLKEVDSLALSNAQLHLELSFKNFFKDPKHIGYPKFKSKKKSKKSYTTNNQQGTIYLENGYIRLPKVGKVRIKQHRKIKEDSIIKNVTISQSPSGKYYASIVVEYESQVKPQEIKRVIGLDFSMHELYIDSEGNKAEYPRYYRKAEERLAREQRRLSKMKYGSNNYEKQRVIVSKQHEKVSNKRKDFLHKQSRAITKSYDAVCIEDLNMKSMSGALNFGKSVHDNGWGIFVRMLEYKLESLGKRLIKIDKYYPSSQTCSVCEYQNKDTKDLSLRVWTCPRCGTHHDRDKNAAENIKYAGIQMLLGY